MVRSGTFSNNDGKGKIEPKNKLNKTGEIPHADVAKTLVGALQDSVVKNKTFEILEGDTNIKAALEQC